MSMYERGFTEKHIKSTKRYLELRDYKILDESWEGEDDLEIDFVCQTEDSAGYPVIAFIDCGASDTIEDGFYMEKKTPQEFEELIYAYFKGRDDFEESTLRYETIGICVVGEHKALLRHGRHTMSD